MKLKTPQKTMQYFGLTITVPYDHTEIFNKPCSEAEGGGIDIYCKSGWESNPEYIIARLLADGTLHQRRAMFFGIELVVPINTSYLAADFDGEIIARSDAPWTEPNFWEGYEIAEIAHVDLEEADWDDTLVNIE